ncbi:MAG: hypothetical protein O210_OD1C00001G0633 [Parcubacteria bacterium RAAC4_OD1_1]|nr:MAG: hypothetical protein O210_OD1C00001G0633 [Parcubacteria bacterium RAAC4_OD1_1]
MKEIVLNSNEVRLLRKVEKAGYGFFVPVSSFLEEFKDASEEDVLPELVLKKDEFEDVVEMIEDYLCNDGLSDEDWPSKEEESELRNLLERLEA